MCGIAGIINSKIENVDLLRMDRMLDLLRHRGPDARGIWNGNGICLGHCRLAIIDLTHAADQPMTDGMGLTLIFNGEIYNFIELRGELEKRGVRFKSRSDTEVLLQGYRAWGEEILHRLKGFFSFAIWDDVQGKLFCARDPFGKKPFYFCKQYNRFVFASEIEAVVAGLDSRPEPNYGMLSYYLLKGYFPDGQSAYESIHTLKAGESMCLSVRDWRFSERIYRKISFNLEQSKSALHEDHLGICSGLFQSAVKRRLQSDVPLGVLLSGGVDSSLTALTVAEVSQVPPMTFSATFKGTSSDESKYAFEIADTIKSDHHETNINIEDFSVSISKLVRTYGEPFGDYSAIPTYFLFESLKPFVKVALTGDGSDEIFGGYKDILVFLLRQTLSKFIGIGDCLKEQMMTRLLHKRLRIIRELGFACLAMKKNAAPVFYRLSSSGWTSDWRKPVMRPEAWKQTFEENADSEYELEFKNSGKTDLEKYLNMSLERLTQDFLVKIDRASMAHSIEARNPFLDIDLVDWARRLPSSVLFRNGEPKALPKELLAKKMGNRFARRPKKGFTPPLEHWLRQPVFYEWVRKNLTNNKCFVYTLFCPDGIQKILEHHRRGFDHSGRLWKLIFLNAWHKSFF